MSANRHLRGGAVSVAAGGPLTDAGIRAYIVYVDSTRYRARVANDTDVVRAVGTLPGHIVNAGATLAKPPGVTGPLGGPV